MGHRDPLVGSNQFPHRGEHLLEAALIGCDRCQRRQCRIPQPSFLMLQVGKQEINLGHDLVGRSPSQKLNGGVLDEPRLLRVPHGPGCQLINLQSDRISPGQEGSEHRSPHPGIAVLQKLHHQFLPHPAASRATTKIAARNPHYLVRGNIADIEIVVMHVFP